MVPVTFSQSSSSQRLIRGLHYQKVYGAIPTLIKVSAQNYPFAVVHPGALETTPALLGEFLNCLPAELTFSPANWPL